jgi:hypothetical protein
VESNRQGEGLMGNAILRSSLEKDEREKSEARRAAAQEASRALSTSLVDGLGQRRARRLEQYMPAAAREDDPDPKAQHARAMQKAEEELAEARADQANAEAEAARALADELQS